MKRMSFDEVMSSKEYTLVMDGTAPIGAATYRHNVTGEVVLVVMNEEVFNMAQNTVNTQATNNTANNMEGITMNENTMKKTTMNYKEIAREVNASLGTDFATALEGKINDEYAYFAYDTIDDLMGDDCEYAVFYKVAKVNRHLWRVTKYYRIWSDGYYHDSEQDHCDFWLNSRQRNELKKENVVPLIWNDGYYTSETYGDYSPRTPWGDNPAFDV